LFIIAEIMAAGPKNTGRTGDERSIKKRVKIT
jgi:hypothetical protein